MTKREQLISWLNHAYAMEQAAVKVLENHASDAKDHPTIHHRIEEHALETREHVKRVERCLAILGERPSTLKSAWAKMTGMVQGLASGPFDDEIIKNFLSDYAAEHLEIASYISLIAAAEALEEPTVIELCSATLRDEEAMADWLEGNLAEVTQMFLGQQLAQTWIR